MMLPCQVKLFSQVDDDMNVFFCIFFIFAFCSETVIYIHLRWKEKIKTEHFLSYGLRSFILSNFG